MDTEYNRRTMADGVLFLDKERCRAMTNHGTLGGMNQPDSLIIEKAVRSQTGRARRYLRCWLLHKAILVYVRTNLLRIVYLCPKEGPNLRGKESIFNPCERGNEHSHRPQTHAGNEPSCEDNLLRDRDGTAYLA